MKLNAKKCKELRVCFFKATPQLPLLRIDGQVLETVRSHKVLGLVIQDNLKWNENTCMIVSKASEVASERLIFLLSTSLSYVPS